MRKIISLIILSAFLLVIISESYAGVGQYKKFALPLLGVSAAAGYGAFYFRKKAVEKFNEADDLYQEYLDIPKGQPNDVFEEKYEKYEDKYSEGSSFKTYYLLCLGGSILTFAGSLFLLFSPSSDQRAYHVGYKVDFVAQSSDVYLNVKF